MDISKLLGNYKDYLEYLPIFGIGILISFLLAPIIGYIARKANVIDYHYARTTTTNHKKSDFRRLRKPPQALLGGLATVFPLIFLALWKTQLTADLAYFLVALAVLIVMGVLDDKYDLPGTTQYFVQLAAALIIAFSPINLSFIAAPFGEGVLKLDQLVFKTNLLNIPIDLVFPGDLLLVGWILVCINAVKFSFGTDGTSEGNTFVAAVTIFILSLRYQYFTSAIISVALAGLLLGFLFFSFPISKIRAGSVGKTTYGFIIAVLSIMIGCKLPIALILLFLPLLDFVRVLIGRLIRHKPKSVRQLLLISDQTHFHHRLLDLGFTETQIALVEFTISLALGAAALAYSGAYRGFILLAAGTLIVALYVIIRFYHRRKTQQPEPPTDQTPEAKYSY